MLRPDYAKLVSQAESAVAGVKDPELKRVAFQKVLDDLLGPRSAAEARKGSTARKTGKRGEKKSLPKRSGPQGYIEEMVDEAFFKKPKTIAQVKAELANHGHHIPLTSLSGPLQKLCQRRILRRQKTKSSGKKQTYSYSEY